MTRRSLAGRPRVGLLALLLSGALVAAGPPPASADPGRAPAPREYRVLQKLHTDAIATFLDGEHFVLGSKADVFEGLGTRLDPEQLWFHVDDASRLTVPAGMEFIAPAGTQVWVAPQSNPSGGQLWPGFSTESVPVGAIENDTTTLRLVELQGPGTLELFTTGTFGARERLWSSDDTQFSSFQVPRTHMHANWAFTQPGTYRLTVEAAARRAGQPVSTIATYTFVVGALPADIATTTTLAASAGEVTAGDPVALTATVTPASAEGYVEFRDGSTVLGHQAVTGGTAMLTVPDLAPGDHALTAVFVPKVANLADGSTSAIVDVTVREPGNVPFSVTGIQGSYGVGDTLSAKVAGASLKEGQQFRWLVRPIGSPSTGSNRQTGTSETFSATVDALWDETELSVTVREGATVVAQSPWVPLRVEQVGTRPTVTLAANTPSPLLPGDVAEFVVSGRQPAEGETLQWGFLSGVTWIDVPRQLGGNWTYTFPDALTSRLTNITTGVTTVQDYPYGYGVRILKDGVTVARSPLTTLKIGPRELQVQGHRQLYREGGTVQMDATVYPVRDSDRFSYTWTFTNGDVTEVWGQDRPVPALTKTGLTKAAHDGGTLTLTLNNHGEPAQRRQFKLNVTDDASSQILAFSTLAGHYHQGDAVALELTVDPPPVQGDTLTWEWRWPGTEQWVPMAGVVDNTYRVTAEQALDGVEIRAKLTFANPLTPPAISETRTIHVDDHGTAPNQKVTIAGETAYQAGDTATLTARVAPGTVLDRYQWYAKAPGAAEPTAIAGANGATHSFSASSSDDGSEYTVAVLRPGGQVAYGPSAPMRLSVAPREAAVDASVGGVVPATLALTLGAPAAFGTFLPGVAREYTAATTATVVSSAGMATLTVGDPSDTHRGHLVNGAVALPQPLQGLGTIKTYDGPVANDVATVEFKQRIGSADPLRTGTYSKTLTFTLATNTP